MRYILDAVASGLEMRFTEAEDYEATLFGLLSTTEDMREGTKAFLEKRKAGVQRDADRPHMRIAIVLSQYHAFITERLEAGARAVLREAGVTDDAVETFAVPGAYELAQAAQRVAESGEWAAIVCLGCLIRGETPHFDYIAQRGVGRHHARRAERPACRWRSAC